MSEKIFDLIVIGAGPGGYVAAIRAAQLGMNVACIEKESVLGGTCLRIGCIPSKVLLESSHLFAQCRSGLGPHGIKVSGLELDLPAMLKRKDQVVSTLTRGVEALFKKNKITRITGLAKISRPGLVKVISEKGETEIEGKNILIATGSKPGLLPGVELNGDLIGTSAEALSYPEVPNHLVVIGAGYIGLELGSVWARLGAKVTVLEFLDRILFGMDAEIAGEAKKLFEKQGIEFRLGARVTKAAAKNGKCVVECDGMPAIECDRVLLAAGRVPNTEHLGLEAAGLELHKKGFIPVNSHFATSAEGIYAIGDVIAGPMLAHKAQEEGIACVEQLAGHPAQVNYSAIPGVAYTHPEIASVGRTEEQLKEAEIPFRKGVFPFRGSGRARTLGEVDGMVKILANTETDRVEGIHILGPHAGELINEAASAMSFGASSEDIARVCHAHPTLGEALKEAALAVNGRPIHM